MRDLENALLRRYLRQNLSRAIATTSSSRCVGTSTLNPLYSSRRFTHSPPDDHDHHKKGESILSRILEERRQRHQSAAIPEWARVSTAWVSDSARTASHPTSTMNQNDASDTDSNHPYQKKEEYIPLLFRLKNMHSQHQFSAWKPELSLGEKTSDHVAEGYSLSNNNNNDNSFVSPVERLDSSLTDALVPLYEGNTENRIDENSDTVEEKEWTDTELQEGGYSPFSSHELPTPAFTYTTKVSHIDPVTWLAQDYNAPLIAEDVLQELTRPPEVVVTGGEKPFFYPEGLQQERNKMKRLMTEAKVMKEGEEGSQTETTVEENTMDAGTDATQEATTTTEQEQHAAEDSSLDTATVEEYNLSPEEDNVAVPSATTETDREDSHDKPTEEDKDDVLVYNVFTKRVAKASSPSVVSLAMIGVGVDYESRELRVTDPAQLLLLGAELRAGRVAWPASWTRGALYQQISRLLRSVTEEESKDTVARVEELLKMHYKNSQFRRQTGVVGAVSPTQRMEIAEESKLYNLHDLNPEQQEVVQFALQGYHTYIGGGAGTGKSVLLRVLRQQLLREGLTVAMTATTGIAASHLGGCTLHHCFGINVLGEFIRRKELAAYDVVIIDEVSMLSRDIFERFDAQLRRANGVDLPFGGVQIILCGDFLQLGAVNAQPLITSPLFRRFFAMMKLQTVMRQRSNLLYAEQLSALRRGNVPDGLENTVQFLTAESSALEQQKEEELKKAQLESLTAIVGEEKVDAMVAENKKTEDKKSNFFVEGAVNLLPTNQQVDVTNLQQLQKLPGEEIVFNPQILAPTLIAGDHQWSPTYLLRVHTPKLHYKRAVELLEFYIHGFLRKKKEFLTSSWMATSLGQQNIVIYPLFVDALALRVRLPAEWEEKEKEEFLQHINDIDSYLLSVDIGLRVREIIPHGEGMHSERDEDLLQHYAARAPMANPLSLKIGAQVMLRANLAPGLVNGSLGTVVGFRRMEVDAFPPYLVGTKGNREESIASYRDFLCYEESFREAIVPEVDFGGGRVEPIPPLTFYVGGLANTHHYSLGITALPLSLAYAFTVHKVQGLTLVGRVHLELSRMWPCEHLLYVAMSRVRNPEQLSISHFHRDLVRAASDCVLFDDCLPAVTEVKVKPYFIAATWKRSPQRRKKVLKRAQLDRLAKRLAEKKRIQKEEAEEREKKRITAIQTSLQNS